MLSNLDTSLLDDVVPVASETFSGVLVDHEREYLLTPEYLERIDAHNC